MRQIKGKTLQEHIWNSMGDIPNYSTWHWVQLFNHFKLKIKGKEFNKWCKELASEGVDFFDFTNTLNQNKKNEVNK